MSGGRHVLTSSVHLQAFQGPVPLPVPLLPHTPAPAGPGRRPPASPHSHTYIGCEQTTGCVVMAASVRQPF